MLDAASGEPTWKGSPAPEGVGGMSSAAGTGTFVECPKCKPGSGKPIGHLGRHLGVLVPVCPPAPVEVLASAGADLAAPAADPQREERVLI